MTPEDTAIIIKYPHQVSALSNILALLHKTLDDNIAYQKICNLLIQNISNIEEISKKLTDIYAQSIQKGTQVFLTIDEYNSLMSNTRIAYSLTAPKMYFHFFNLFQVPLKIKMISWSQ